MLKYIKYILIVLSILALAACSSTPKSEEFYAEAEFQKANEDIEDNLLEDARIRFENIIRMDTKYVYAPLAQLRIADSYIKDDSAEIAIEEYRRFLDTYPRHKYASYAQYQIALAYFNMIRGPERGYGAALNALDHFLALNAVYPRNPYRKEVKIKIAQSEKIIAEHELMVGAFYFKRDAYHGAIDRLEGLVEDFPDYANDPEVLRMLAVSQRGLGNMDSSAEYLLRLESMFPKSKSLKKAKKAIRKLSEE
jgi:outer membrane protein assembly factor BamD